MKHLVNLFLVLLLLGCDDSFLDIYHYSRIITGSKEYSVYLDMSEIGKVQVKSETSISTPFKILSDERFYFVGDMLKGVHVYKKTPTGAYYLCYIECRYIKDFEVAGNLLFCNNLLDMLVIDAGNLPVLNILHREENYFNRFNSYKKNWNFPYEAGKGIITGKKTYELTGRITDKQPNLDFSAYDQLYGNLTTKELPDNWFSKIPQYDKPYIGMVKMNNNTIYTYGEYNSWSICTWSAGAFSAREEDLWTTPRGYYAPPYYYSNAFPYRMFFEDDIIYNLGSLDNLSGGYLDCIIYNEEYPIYYPFYFPGFIPVDICYMPQMDAFFVLSGTSIWGVFITGNGIPSFSKTMKDYQVSDNATEIFRSGDNLVTLGDKLSVYAVTENEMKLIKEYPDIKGACGKKEGDTLVVVNGQGLFFYDIEDLEDIQLMP